MATTNPVNVFDTQHVDMIHDAQLDYYGKRLATCSSDRSIKIFSVDNDAHILLATLVAHDGPVWQVAWAHPKFGTILATCSYDSKVFVWKELNSNWVKVKDHAIHSASVNAIAWAPHDYGLVLAAASSDGKISILTYKDDGTWDMNTLNAHSIGVNSVSWAPSFTNTSLISASNTTHIKRFASGGCDNIVKIWKEEDGTWKEEASLQGHTDWVRDVAFTPNVGFSKTCLASCSQDKTVIIWTLDPNTSKWTSKPLTPEPFIDVVWRVSWSIAGNVLAVSCGDNKITLWKENVEGVFTQIGDVNETS
ncbi:WD40-repeat-containing domain protein [Globomyces pollinis-pini]|nr:WD40-repeat-containing domain protein [Globomyces pollinis-pini]